jgi:hydroxyacylglutathione hydrolase
MEGNNLCNVIVIPMEEDNFCYYIYKQDNIQKGVFIDVSEDHKLEAFKAEFGINTVTDIYTTHKHYDHADGNLPCTPKYPGLRIWGGELDNIPGCTNPVSGNMEWEPFTGVKCKGYHTPCHT